ESYSSSQERYQDGGQEMRQESRRETAVAAPVREREAPATLPPSPEPPESLQGFGARLAAGVATRAQRVATSGQHLWHGLRSMTIEQWAWVGVLLVASVVRIWGMGDKPLHHDESMHAYYSYIFARDPSSYVYDPLLHGPFQFHAAGFVFMVILALEWLV